MKGRSCLGGSPPRRRPQRVRGLRKASALRAELARRPGAAAGSRSPSPTGPLPDRLPVLAREEPRDPPDQLDLGQDRFSKRAGVDPVLAGRDPSLQLLHGGLGHTSPSVLLPTRAQVARPWTVDRCSGKGRPGGPRPPLPRDEAPGGLPTGVDRVGPWAPAPRKRNRGRISDGCCRHGPSTLGS